MLTLYNRKRKLSEVERASKRNRTKTNKTCELQVDLGRELKFAAEWNSTQTTLHCKESTLITPTLGFDLTWLGRYRNRRLKPADELTVKFINSKDTTQAATTYKLHPVISARLLGLFAKGEPRSAKYVEYCCFDFAHELMFGRGCIPAYTHFSECFVQRRLSTRYNVNDVVVIANANGDRLHYAMSIGQDLFISKFGVHGVVAVTTLDELMRIYHSECHFRLTPQRDKPEAFFNVGQKLRLVNI